MPRMHKRYRPNDVLGQKILEAFHYGITNIKERSLMEFRLGFGIGDRDGMTLKETGDLFGMTEEGVRNYENNIINRMKLAMIIASRHPAILKDYAPRTIEFEQETE